MTRHSQRQSGIALTVFVLIFFAIAVVFVANYSLEFTNRNQAEGARNRVVYLESMHTRVLDWYRSNAARVDSDMFQASITADSIISDLAEPLRYGATLELSNRLTQGPIRFRRIVVWMPNEDDATENPPVFDANTGEFRPCTTEPCRPREFITIDGAVVQNELFQQANSQLDDLAYKAQQYFKAHYLSDADNDVGINYFRNPRGDASNSSDYIGSINTFTAIPVSAPNGSVLRALSLSQSYAINPWGNSIEASNLEASQATAPPYSMAFRSVTPWGFPIIRYAVQPL